MSLKHKKKVERFEGKTRLSPSVPPKRAAENFADIATEKKGTSENSLCEVFLYGFFMGLFSQVKNATCERWEESGFVCSKYCIIAELLL